MEDRIAEGRTDLVLDLVASGHPATATDRNGASLIQWCAYYGDVSAIKFLLSRGEMLSSLGHNYDLGTACFHGHWRLVQFVIESGADVNDRHTTSGETPLHAALCKSGQPTYERVVRVLLAHGANPNVATNAGVETEGFMRDVRCKGETPLHRAAAFGSEESIEMLLKAGAKRDARDANGDSPLSWASWHLRPAPILRKLAFDGFHVHPHSAPMEVSLLGKPVIRVSRS